MIHKSDTTAGMVYARLARRHPAALGCAVAKKYAEN
jgi:hypothetical protein